MHIVHAVIDFAESSYTIGENDVSIPICVGLVSGVNSFINGSIKTSSSSAIGMLRDLLCTTMKANWKVM